MKPFMSHDGLYNERLGIRTRYHGVETIHDVHLPLGESEAKFGPSVCLAKLLSLKIVPYDEKGGMVGVLYSLLVRLELIMEITPQNYHMVQNTEKRTR